MQLQVANIDLQMPIKDFTAQLEHQKDNWSEPMSVNIKPMQTRNGKNVYKVSVDNDSNSGSVYMIAEQHDVSQDIIFKPMTMRKLSNGFYNLSYNDSSIINTQEDPMIFLATALQEICENNKGTLAYQNQDGVCYLIRNGKMVSASLGIVADDGTVYSMHNAKDIGSEGDLDTSFHVKVPINEWLGDHADVQKAIASMPTVNDKMNFIGKYLINARNNDEIDSDEFMDIFRQAGLFGFTDNTVKMIYKLIM